jgi:hypothetical protein
MSISAAGLHQDMESMGFSDTDCIREAGFENPLDANAPELRHYYDYESAQPTIIFADSGPGMDETALKESRTLFRHKDARDDKNGCFGIGGSLGSAQLTRLSGTSTRLSKTIGGNLLQVKLDYRKIVKEDKYDIHVHEATASNEAYWNRFAIDKEHGTLEILECPKDVVESLVDSIPQAKYARMYSDYLSEGTKMSIYVNGKLFETLVPEDISDIRNATLCEKSEIHVWGKTSDGKHSKDVLVQFLNGRGQLVYRDLSSEIQIEEDPATKGYTLIGSIQGTSTLRYTRGATDNWNLSNGGDYFKRVRKVVEHNIKPLGNTGDFDNRKIISYSRHVWTYTTKLDSLMGTEINKSRMNKEKIHPLIVEAMEFYRKKFTNHFIKQLPKEQSSQLIVSTKSSTPTVVGMPTVIGKPTVATPTVATPTVATPTVATPTVATPTVATPTVATPTVATPTVATPTVATPTVATPTVATPTPVATRKSSTPTNTVVSTLNQKAAPIQEATKQTVIPIPAHIKRVAQSQYDLVLHVTNFKTKLNSYDLTKLQKNASTSAEKGVSKIISMCEDITKILDELSIM